MQHTTHTHTHAHTHTHLKVHLYKYIVETEWGKLSLKYFKIKAKGKKNEAKADLHTEFLRF